MKLKLKLKGGLEGKKSFQSLLFIQLNLTIRLMIYAFPECVFETLRDRFIDICRISSDIFSLEYSNKDTNLSPEQESRELTLGYVSIDHICR